MAATRWPATRAPGPRTSAPGAAGGPPLMGARVVPLPSPSSDDDQRRYRDPAEVEALKENDPIPFFSNRLRAAGLLTDEADAGLRAEIKTETNEAQARAEARPDPDAALAHRR